MFLESKELILYENVLLSETYYGKIDEMVECEGYFEEMKKWLLVGKNPNKCPAKDKFEKLIAKTFGFEEVYYSIINVEYMGNSFTLPFFSLNEQCKNDHYFDLVKTKNGIKFKNPEGKILYVYSYNYTLRNFTASENMAIFMHELGHNFFLVKNHIKISNIGNKGILRTYQILILAYSHIINNLCMPFAIQDAFQFMAHAMKNKGQLSQSYYLLNKSSLEDKRQNRAIKIHEKLNSNKFIKIFFDTLGISCRTAMNIKSLNNLRLWILNDFPTFIFKCVKNNFFKSIYTQAERGLDNEKFADNFALSYGYNVEIIEIFKNNGSRFLRSTDNISKIPALRVINSFNNAMVSSLNHFADPHPGDSKRALMTLEKAKYELENNKDELSPKQVAELEDQIDKMENILKNMPLIQKSMDKFFNLTFYNFKDKVLTKYSDEEIYDYDKKIINDYITENEDNLLEDYLFDLYDD